MIRLKQRGFLGLLVNPFGTTARVLELDDNVLRSTRRGRKKQISLEAVTAAPMLRKGALGTKLTIPVSGSGGVTLRAARHNDARTFAEQVRQAWVAFNLDALDRESERFDRICRGIADLAAPSRYPAACCLVLVLTDARALDARTALQQLDPLWDELFPAEQARIVALLVERVHIGTDGLNVRLRVEGLSALAREMLAGGIGEAA